MAHSLVPSNRIETAPVYGRDGRKIGTIERLMLEKEAGTVAYAVVRCGGLLDEVHHYPVAWSSLKYDMTRKALCGRRDAGGITRRSVRTRWRDVRLGRPLADLSASAVLDRVRRVAFRLRCEAPPP
jgi:sporulation protein YlmC with PRC-barrel domain